MIAAGAVADAATRAYWRLTGREIELDGEQAWLDAPVSAGPRVDDGWIERHAASVGGGVATPQGAGLLADMSLLDGPEFRARELEGQVRAFYEHTSRWRMEVWLGWSRWLRPGGAVVGAAFGRRVGQLAIPVDPLAVAHGMDSEVRVITDGSGCQIAAAWLRRLRATGEYVYSGCYGVRRLPGTEQPRVHVAFPLEQGNVQVFLRPEVGPGGSLRLTSPRGRFGSDGAYVVVRRGGRADAARVPIHEEFHVYVDDEGVLRTDHRLDLWNATAVRLHYRLTEAEPADPPAR
ncbi:hypothetical protein [Mobilicoccus caccae]|uniref:hypothetical protein n=1 Tax=Mobilicoccus caccae TaxID=1859295 RepID=UPI0024E0A918|nr:hypothetical protein [Mobilicoccus caccae]